MAIGAITAGDQDGAKPSSPVFMDVVSFLGDDSYPAGGTLAFEATLRAVVGDSREIIAVIGQDCGGYVPVYVPSTGALKVYEGDYDPAATGPLTENATADLSGTTFNLLVISR